MSTFKIQRPNSEKAKVLKEVLKISGVRQWLASQQHKDNKC